jgi:hypothetical protein
MHIKFVETAITTRIQYHAQTRLNITSPDGMLNDRMANLLIISSHTAGTFKTDTMIKDIIVKTGTEETAVFTKYAGDIEYCEKQGIDSTLISDNFDYSCFENRTAATKKSQ